MTGMVLENQHDDVPDAGRAHAVAESRTALAFLAIAPGSLEAMAPASPTAAVAMVMTLRTSFRVFTAFSAVAAAPCTFLAAASDSSRVRPTALVTMSVEALRSAHSLSSRALRSASLSVLEFLRR